MTVLFLPKRSLCACVCLVWSAPLWAQTATPPPLIVTRDAPLHRSANEQSEALTQLPAQSRVTAQGQRQGAWVQVKTEQGISGWLRLFQLGQIPSSTAPGQADSSWVRGFSSWLGGSTSNRAQPVATTTIGIRGLEASDIANAQPNPGAVTQAEHLRIDASQAQHFAQRSGLQRRAVDELPNTTPQPGAMVRDMAQ